MEPTTESVANGADGGMSQTRSAETSPDHEVQFRPQAATLAARGWQPMTRTDIDDYRMMWSIAPRAAANKLQRMPYTTAMSSTAT